LIEATYTGTAADVLRVNGVDVSSAGAGGTNPSANWALFARADGALGFSHTAIQEAAITRVLTAPQKASTRSYFARRYPHVGMV